LGVEELIRQASDHIEAIGPFVQEGRYDLVGPDGEIILPQVWEMMIQPGWAIAMYMWPLPDRPSTPGPPLSPAESRHIIIVESDATIRSSERKRKDNGGLLGGLLGPSSSSYSSRRNSSGKGKNSK
jgi:hypothetical protein